MKNAFKRIICFSAVLIYTACIFAVSAGAASGHLLIIGDSISTGYGLKDASTQSFGELLSHALNISGSDYVNIAKNGATSADILSIVQSHSSDIASANTIMITAGGNDILHPFISEIALSLGLPANSSFDSIEAAASGCPDMAQKLGAQLSKPVAAAVFDTAEKNFAANFASIIASVRKSNPSASLYVQTIYNPFSGVPGYDATAAFSDKVVAVMNDAINAGASDGNYKVIDTAAAFSGKAVIYTNIAGLDIHPNALGHYLIFCLAYDAVTGHAYGDSGSGSASSAMSSAASSAVSTNVVKNPPTGGVASDPTALAYICAGLAIAALAGTAVTCALKAPARKR